MSGGSHNYLYLKAGTPDLASASEDLSRMATRLDELGAADAATATLDIGRVVEKALAVAPTLVEVWHNVEWYDSGDSERKSVSDALSAWRVAHTEERVDG